MYRCVCVMNILRHSPCVHTLIRTSPFATGNTPGCSFFKLYRYRYAGGAEERFLQDFLEILKRILQNS